MFTKRFFQVLFLAGISGLSFAITTPVLKTTTDIKTESKNIKEGFLSSKKTSNALPKQVLECTGGGSESFTNLGTNQTAYISRTWIGDNGVAWSATESRNDQTLNDKAITLRSQGKLTNDAAVAGGIGTLNFNFKRVFTGNSTLRVFVNGVQKDSIVVSSETPTAASILVNLEGNVNLEFRNSGNRIVIDDVAWDCYGTGATAPQLQLADADDNNVDCGTFAVNFGAAPVGTQKDSVFSIKNTGTASLAINSLSLSGADAGEFTIVSPLPGAFSIAPQDAAPVTVRFNNTAAGSKTAVLTINRSDVAEQCTVNLLATGLLQCTAPAATATLAVTDANPLFANVAVSNVTAGGYLAVLSDSSTLGATPTNGDLYELGDDFGTGMVVYNGTDANFAISVLDFGSAPYVHIFPYNAGDCFGGPVYAAAVSQTFAVPCAAGYETFANVETITPNSYLTRNWIGDFASWRATDARTDQTLTGKGIALRAGSLKNTTPITGIGTITFNYKRVFTGDSTLKLLVNGDQYGADIPVSSETPQVFSQVVQLSADAVIEIVNSGNRVVIDNLSWTCYQAPATPKIQLADNSGAQRACGNFTVDFGNIAEGVNRTRTFNITNVGGQDLLISSITPDNGAFSVTSALPSVIAPNASAQVTVVLNSTGLAVGALDANINIASNDVSCALNLTANVALPCEAPVAGTVAAANTTYFSTDVTMTGTADGYVAVVTPTPFSGTLPSEGFPYGINEPFADGFIGYAGTATQFTINSGLEENVTYYLTVFAYNNSEDCAGPAFAAPATTTFTTLQTLCGGAETFTNIGAPQSNYITRSWTGDNQVTWTATDARTDQTLTGKAITLRTGALTNTNFPSSQGITNLSFNYKRVFTGNSTLKVYVNEVQVGSNVAVTSETPAPFNVALNITGNVTIRIENSGNRVVIDDLTWTCNASSPKAPLKGKLAGSTSTSTDVKVYPNPNKGQFQIQLGASDATAVLAVYDLTGKKVFGKNVADNDTIDLGNVQKGMYLVSITSGSTVATKKIVVE